MSTITVILEADADGTLHLPLPADLREGKLKVTATVERTSEESEEGRREAALAALLRLQERGTFREIKDPGEWQREIRQDRPIAGRDE